MSLNDRPHPRPGDSPPTGAQRRRASPANHRPDRPPAHRDRAAAGAGRRRRDPAAGPADAGAWRPPAPDRHNPGDEHPRLFCHACARRPASTSSISTLAGCTSAATAATACGRSRSGRTIPPSSTEDRSPAALSRPSWCSVAAGTSRTGLEVVELLDGPLGAAAEGVFAEAAEAARKVLETTTIADVAYELAALRARPCTTSSSPSKYLQSGTFGCPLATAGPCISVMLAGAVLRPRSGRSSVEGISPAAGPLPWEFPPPAGPRSAPMDFVWMVCAVGRARSAESGVVRAERRSAQVACGVWALADGRRGGEVSGDAGSGVEARPGWHGRDGSAAHGGGGGGAAGVHGAVRVAAGTRGAVLPRDQGARAEIT